MGREDRFWEGVEGGLKWGRMDMSERRIEWLEVSDVWILILRFGGISAVPRIWGVL